MQRLKTESALNAATENFCRGVEGRGSYRNHRILQLRPMNITLASVQDAYHMSIACHSNHLSPFVFIRVSSWIPNV
jgi:hypothetical protein